MQIGRNDDAKAGARSNVDVGIHAALADQAQLWKAFEKRRLNLGSLPKEHERFGIFQALAESVHLLRVVVPDLHVVAVELLEAVKRSQRVEVIIQNGYFHVPS